MIKILNILRKINIISALAGASLYALMTGVCFLQVVMRYFFESALQWPEECARFAFIWLAYLAFAISMFTKAHLRVDALVIRFPLLAQRIIEAINMLISAVFCFYIAWLALEMIEVVRESEITAMTMPIPLALVWLSIPVGFTLSGIYALFYSVCLFSGRLTVEDKNEEVLI